ncbi:MAG: 8-oxo-dGTP diphosphatase [Candidatus Paceibacterota bacterium]
MKKILNLCLIADTDKILLGMKKRGWGEGRWNGFGGKVEEGETIEESAKREMLEESGITIREMEERGVVEFTYLDSGKIMEVHIFHISVYEGDPIESDEMMPKWFSISEIPLEKMWPDDSIWMPLFLAGKKFQGKMTFKDTNTIVNHNLQIL